MKKLYKKSELRSMSREEVASYLSRMAEIRRQSVLRKSVRRSKKEGMWRLCGILKDGEEVRIG